MQEGERGEGNAEEDDRGAEEPAHLRGPLTRQVDLVRARLMEIRGAIRALEGEHEGLLVEVTEIMEELDGDDL